MRLRSIVLPVIAMFGLVPGGTRGRARSGAVARLQRRRRRAALSDPDLEPADPAPAAPPYPAARSRARAVAPPVTQLHDVTFAFGSRFWYSTGTLAKDLYDDPRSSQNLNSRLTYAGLTSGTFEGFGRADTAFGAFLKGNAGFSGLNSGSLNDEDFPPALTPYSNTLSQQQGGKLGYGSIDFGQILVTRERVSAGLFVGYGYLNETVNAYGCEQLASNPFVCQPAIGPGVLGITEESHWQFARLGLFGEFKLLDCLKLGAEVAWLPYTQLGGQDTHWLRLGSGLFDFSGPIPESGGGGGGAARSHHVVSGQRQGLGRARRTLLVSADPRQRRPRERHRRPAVPAGAAAAQFHHHALRRLRARRLQVRADLSLFV